MDTDRPAQTRVAVGQRPPVTGRAPAGLAGLAALAGLVAAVAAMAAAEVAALATGPGSVPVIAVGTAVIPLVPESVKQAAIASFGTSDKTALIVGTAVLLGLAAAAVGVFARRRPLVGDLGIAALGLVGVLATGRPGVGGPGSVIPSVVAAVVGILSLRRLLGRVRATGDDPSGGGGAGNNGGAGAGAGTGTGAGAGSRRMALAGLGSVAAGAAAVGAVGALGMRTRFGGASARAGLTLPGPVDPAPAQPGGVDPGVPGAVPFITPNGDFYRIDTALFVPHIDPNGWRLRIRGMVDRELTLDLPTLLRRGLIERDITLNCVSNEVGGTLIGTARWLGVPLAPLLAEVGVNPRANQLVARDGHGMSIGSPVSVVTDGRDGMLAVGMNGAPLPFEHGFPVRMVVPGLYGYVSACKWITDIELTTFDAYDAYWVQRGWGQRGPVKVSARIDTPRDGAKRAAGTVVVAGVAWAQHVGIARVQVRVDDQPWADAQLAPVLGPDTWRQWSWRYPATAGTHTLTVRATTSSGEVQTDAVAGTIPDGATGLHRVTIDVTS